MLIISTGFCIWYKLRPHPIPGVYERNNGVKWNDTLMKHLPAGMDTTIVVKDVKGTPLKFGQYIKPVFNHEAAIYQDRGVWRFERLTETAKDSLKKDDDGVARWERWDEFRKPDTIKSWQTKLNSIAHTLAQADYVMVLKSQRKMFISRKGVNLATLNVNIGWTAEGKKTYEKDGKTPEGVYYLDCKYVRPDKYYKSFLISYPNAADKLNAQLKGLKPGGGVCIHGTRPGKEKAKDWTAGCIALANSDMDVLFDYVASGTVIDIRK
ncbi:MAG: L,D-transpeptidase family protein [Bacteroidota bacterium]